MCSCRWNYSLVPFDAVCNFYTLPIFHLKHVFFKFMLFKIFILNTSKKTITYKGLIGLNKDFRTVKDNFYDMKIISSYIMRTKGTTFNHTIAWDYNRIYAHTLKIVFLFQYSQNKTKRICHCLPHSSYIWTSENIQLMIYFSFSQVPARWRKRAAILCDVLFV